MCYAQSEPPTNIVGAMRQLHLAEGESRDGHLVLVTSDGLERFELAIDASLHAALAQTPPVRPVGEPTITAREIQVRVRAGEKPADLADAHNAHLDWVMRFAGPVLDERTRIAGEARRARARRSTTDGQIVVFGEAVDERFMAHGIDPLEVRWDAYRREDGQWLVTATWVGGQSEHSADWVFQLSARMVAPCDDTAADLLSDRPIRPLVPPTPPEPPRSLSLAPPLVPGVVAFPVMAETRTGPLPQPQDEVFDQEDFSDDEPAPASASAAADGPSGGKAEPPADPPADEAFEEPLLPMHVPDADVATGKIPKLTNVSRPKESDDERAARASIPSWDDILLGVRRKRD